MATTREEVFIANLFYDLAAIGKLPISTIIYTTRDQKLKFGKARLMNDGNRFEFFSLSSEAPSSLWARKMNIDKIMQNSFNDDGKMTIFFDIEFCDKVERLPFEIPVDRPKATDFIMKLMYGELNFRNRSANEVFKFLEEPCINLPGDSFYLASLEDSFETLYIIPLSALMTVNPQLTFLGVLFTRQGLPKLVSNGAKIVDMGYMTDFIVHQNFLKEINNP